MIGFFQTGGIGDAILGTSIVRRLHQLYGDVSVIYCDHAVPQVYQGMEFISSLVRADMADVRRYDDLVSNFRQFEFLVFNKFRRNRNNRLSFFAPVSEASYAVCAEYDARYAAALSKAVGRQVENADELDPHALLEVFNSEDNYFADWDRYGVGCGYDGVGTEIYPYTVQRNKAVQDAGRYVVIHDSRLPASGDGVYRMKAWDAVKWKALVGMLAGDGTKIVQIVSTGQAPFADGVVPHYELIGHDAMFQDYLYLLSAAAAYVGTDSWPAHAAIFVREPHYVLLKGAVSRRWDHGGRYSRILRVGGCQACEGPRGNADKCMWFSGCPCMEAITAEMVYSALMEGMSVG